MIERSDGIRQTELSLSYMINNSIIEFYDRYAPYLGDKTQLIKESIHKDSPAKSLRKCVHLVRDTLREVIKKNDEHSLARVKGVSVHGLHFAFSNSYINRNPSHPTRFLQGFYATMH